MSTWPNRGASGGPCGGWNNKSPNSQKKSDHAGLTQANRSPRKPVRFSSLFLGSGRFVFVSTREYLHQGKSSQEHIA
jgi:hypothetical protein